MNVESGTGESLMHWEAHQALTLKAFWAKPGRADVYICRGDLHDYVVLAERYDNPAASVTNAYELYAQQVCERFQLEPKRCVFLELYVYSTLGSRQVTRKFELDVCFPKLSGLTHNRTSWRPGQAPMREAILDSLTSQHTLTESFNVVKINLDSIR
jgi:hypothetical protein